MSLNWLVTLAIVIVLLILLCRKSFKFLSMDDRVLVKAYDGRMYRVRNIDQKEKTAHALAELNGKIIQFLHRLLKESPPDKRTMAYRAAKRYDPNSISEGRLDKKLTSYTVNKGEEVVLCMRTRDTNDHLYDTNKLFYVALHELAHIASITVDHSEEFHKNFRYFLKKATEWNMFKKVKERFNYCGLDVTM